MSVTGGLILVACTVAFLHASDEKPLALRRMEQARRDIVGGSVRWQVLSPKTPHYSRNYVSRYARNGDMIFEDRGNPEGWVVFAEDNQGRVRGQDRHPRLFLLNADGWWETQEGKPVMANLWKRGIPSPGTDRFRDVRNVGITYSLQSLDNEFGFASLWHDAHYPVTRWEERETDGRVIVTARTEPGATIRWEISPAKGWNAEYIEVQFAGQTAEVRCELKQFGDVWLPETTEYRLAGELRAVVRITEARLNQPDDPPRFTAADIGLEPGATIGPQGIPPEEVRLCVWNGDEISTLEQFEEDVRSGRRKRGPTFARARESGGRFESPYDTPEQRKWQEADFRRLKAEALLRRHHLLWYDYVRTFVDRYELDAGQQDKAWDIRRQCERLAQEHLERHRRELDEVAGELLKLRSEPGGDAPRIEQLDARLKRLQEPIDRIFAEHLVPRLDKLPTRAQRQKADEKAAEKAAQEAAAKAQAPASAPARR